MSPEHEARGLGPRPRHEGWWLKALSIAVTVVLCLVSIPILLLALPFLAVAAGWDRWRRSRLQHQFQQRWGTAGKRLVLVYSNSPHWQAYIEQRWLPQLGPIAVILNWSERAQWPERHPVEAEILRRWAGDREFNPVAIVIPPTGPVRAIRFWQAFRDYKHGKDLALRTAESELEAALGISLGARP